MPRFKAKIINEKHLKGGLIVNEENTKNNPHSVFKKRIRK